MSVMDITSLSQRIDAVARDKQDTTERVAAIRNEISTWMDTQREGLAIQSKVLRNAQIKACLGVPAATILTELGYERT